ncbi:MAG: glutaredoxin family protein [Deltaproteobacteria bacterium]|nr:glutaredoxin family protein [Deltaproteobacteria bacterium]
MTALLVVGAALGVSGCKKKETPTAEAAGTLPKVTDTATGLLFTWVDDKGEFHVEEKPTAVPAEARDVVRVRVLDGAGAGEGKEFVADLRAMGLDGTYPVKIVPRAEFEDVAVQRRAKRGAVLTPTLAASASASASASGHIDTGGPTVIIYGASWCGPCHQAQAYLRKRGIPFVEHDIEEDPSKAKEMQEKLARAGKRGGSIPVIDVRGTILVGFDPNAVEQALAAR